MLKLGILDFGIIPKGHQARQILDHRIDFVPRLDKLGFSRYWLGEHHKEDVAWRSPVPLITLLLGMTENMKIGSAGLIAQFHSMKRIAQDFKLLEYFFHERIDLGIANGFGISNIQLQEFVNTGGNVNKDYFSKEFYIEKIGELLDILRADSNTAVMNNGEFQ